MRPVVAQLQNAVHFNGVSESKIYGFKTSSTMTLRFRYMGFVARCTSGFTPRVISSCAPSKRARLTIADSIGLIKPTLRETIEALIISDCEVFEFDTLKEFLKWAGENAHEKTA